MNEAARKARNEYARRYRREHPEKEKLYREHYWEHVAEKAENEKAVNHDNGKGKETVNQ